MAWDRDGGDSGHERVRPSLPRICIPKGKNAGETKRKGDKWTQAIKDKKEKLRASWCN